MKRFSKPALALMLAAVLFICSLVGCGKKAENAPATDGKKTYKIGICNYVDDASLNQIVASVKTRLGTLAAENNVTFDISLDNCNADANLLSQIISNFEADRVDLMVAVATPVAMAMQSATEESGTPVVFAAVSDPVSVGLVNSLQAPGANITGTSDFLNTDAVMQFILATNPEIKKVGLLYNVGQDSSATPIAAAKKFLQSRGIEIIERTGTTVDEISLAAQALIADGVEAVFTPTDNTVMTAELSIYEMLRDAGIPHFTGADSFALNGAFLGYGVDYANLGEKTADMIAQVLLQEKDPASLPVLTFDNGTATVNTEIAQALGYDMQTLESAYAPYCTKLQTIVTAESFDDLK